MSQVGTQSVAIDPMVGARPDEVVLAHALALADGTAAAAGVAGPLDVHLVGPLDVLRRALGPRADDVVLHDAAGRLDPDEDPVVVRGRPTAPLRVLVDLLADGQVDAVRSVAPASQVLTAAEFRLGRTVPAPDAGERGRLLAGARPGLAVRLLLATGPLTVVDAGIARRATALDVLGRMLAVAGPGARLGVVVPTRGDTALADEVVRAAASIDVAVRPLSPRTAVRGEVDVVGCAPQIGATMVQVVTELGWRSDGVARLTGVAGDVAVLDASALAAAGLAAEPTSDTRPRAAERP